METVGALAGAPYWSGVKVGLGGTSTPERLRDSGTMTSEAPWVAWMTCVEGPAQIVPTSTPAHVSAVQHSKHSTWLGFVHRPHTAVSNGATAMSLWPVPYSCSSRHSCCCCEAHPATTAPQTHLVYQTSRVGCAARSQKCSVEGSCCPGHLLARYCR